MRARAVVTTIATIMLSMPVFGQVESVEQQIHNLDKQQREASLRGDFSFEDQRMASDYLAINSSGTFTREQILARVRSGDVKLHAIDVDEEQIHIYGDTAIVTGRDHVRGTFKGQSFEQTAHYSKIWVKQNGAWKLALFQETPIIEPTRHD